MKAAEHFDALETRDPEVREREQIGQLARQIAHAKANAPAFARLLAAIDPAAITTRGALAKVPVTRKSDLLEIQKAARPFGGFAATHWRRGSTALRACSPRRGRSTSRKGAGPTTGGSRARSSLPASARAISCTTASRTTSRRPARCSRPARTRSVARCFPAAPDRPNCRCRRLPISSPTVMSARRPSSGSSSRKPTKWA